MAKINTIGVLTSGGDAPGMNAAIRAVTRAAISHEFNVKGIYRGYRGLVEDEIVDFHAEDVSNIIHRGGTILRTARCKEFLTPEGRQKAYDNMCKHGPIVGIPGTIDNDLYGTDHTVGYDTALNTIMWCVDRIRDTANSHERLFFIEVMGREASFLALYGAIAGGAEAVIIPELAIEGDQLAKLIEHGFRTTKKSSIVLVAENPVTGGAMQLAERVRKEYPQYDVRVTILGHLQRGGSPTAQDRILASRMGATAIEALVEGQRNVMIGDDDEQMVYVPFNKAIKYEKAIDRHLLETISRLSK